ncbi:hypothetical protein BGW39_009455 [Mortierella sp. 14UC]|nr:hypothetical protein BGW39_009455 [Mortierella sp. 14UC]
MSQLLLPVAPTTLAQLVNRLNTAVSEDLSATATAEAEPATTTLAATDTPMATTVGIGKDNTGVTSTSDLRCSSRIARNAQARTDANMTEGTSSASATTPAETTTKKLTRGGKGRKVADSSNTEIQQAQEEADDSAPRKRRKKVAAEDTTTTDDDQNRSAGLPGEETIDDGGVGSSAKQEPDPSPVPKKKVRPPKNSTTDTETTTSTPHTPKAKKSKAATDRKGKGKAKAAVDPTSLDNTGDQAGTCDEGGKDQDDMVIRAISAPPKIDPQDPFSSLPVEILQQILSWLPLPEIARVSMVSKAWLDAIPYLSVWKKVCEEAGLGEPKRKYRTHMALACANSYWICNWCYSYTNAKTYRADLRLPVKDADENDQIHMLCLKCRREHYRNHPESLKKGAYRNEFDWVPSAGSIAPNGIYINYDLSGSQLNGLQTVGTSGHGLPLYDRSEVQRLALRVRGGWVGVDAGATNPRRKRSSACTARADAAKT